MNARLIRAEVQDYRCLGPCVLRPHADSRCTVLAGGNGSGKSSLLDALALVADLVRNSSTALQGEPRGIIGQPLIFASSLLRAGGPTSIQVTLEFEIDGLGFLYRLALTPSGRTMLVTEESLVELGPAPLLLLQRDAGSARMFGGREAPALMPVGPSPSSPALALASDATLWPRIHPAWRYVTGIALVQPVPALMRGPGLAESEPRLPDRYGRDLSQRLFALATARPEGLALFRRDMGTFASWARVRPRVNQGNVDPTFGERDSAADLPLYLASEGTLLQAWLYTMRLTAPDDLSLLLLDEAAPAIYPEQMQHYAEGIRALDSVAQLVLSTHSADVIDEVGRPEDVWILERAPGGPASLTALLEHRHYDAESIAALSLGGFVVRMATSLANHGE